MNERQVAGDMPAKKVGQSTFRHTRGLKKKKLPSCTLGVLRLLEPRIVEQRIEANIE